MVSSVLSVAESTVFCGFLRYDAVNVLGINAFKVSNSGCDTSPESRFEYDAPQPGAILRLVCTFLNHLIADSFLAFVSINRALLIK